LFIFLVSLAALILGVGAALKYGMGRKLGNRDDDFMLQQAYAGMLVENGHSEKRPIRMPEEGGGQIPAEGERAHQRQTSEAPDRLRMKSEFMNRAETAFYGVLSHAFPKTVIFGHVGVPRLLHLDEEDAQARLGDAGGLSVDFAICKNDGERVALGLVIDLDRTGSAQAARAIHERKRTLLRAAGVPLIVYESGSLPDVVTLRGDANRLMAEKRKHKASRHDGEHHPPA
jgi:hypothetical protein